MHAYERIISETILRVSSVIWCTNVLGTLTTYTDITQFIVKCDTSSVDTVKQLLFATTFLAINLRWTGSLFLRQGFIHAQLFCYYTVTIMAKTDLWQDIFATMRHSWILQKYLAHK